MGYLIMFGILFTSCGQMTNQNSPRLSVVAGSQRQGVAQDATAPVARSPHVTSSAPVIDDPLQGGVQEKLRCAPRIKRGNYSYKPDGLHFAIPAPGPQTGPSGPVACVFAAIQERNFTYQVQMSILRGEGGICFRTDPDFHTGYSFVMTKNGAYTLTDIKDNRVLSHGNSSATQNGSQPFFLLLVSAQGGHIHMSVNQQQIASVDDSSSSVGFLGIATMGNQDTSLLFSRVKVWN
jgi:hypothetical protein